MLFIAGVQIYIFGYILPSRLFASFDSLALYTFFLGVHQPKGVHQSKEFTSLSQKRSANKAIKLSTGDLKLGGFSV